MILSTIAFVYLRVNGGAILLAFNVNVELFLFLEEEGITVSTEVQPIKGKARR